MKKTYPPGPNMVNDVFQCDLLTNLLWPVLVNLSLLVLYQLGYHYDQVYILINNQLPESREHIKLGCLNCRELLFNTFESKTRFLT